MTAATKFFTSIDGSSVDAGAGRVNSVSVITIGEAKGHGILIDATTLEQVKACAETHKDGVRVKADHGTGFGSIVGVLRNFQIVGDKLIADLFLLSNHDLRSRIIEMAETFPGSIGLSISFSGEDETKGEQKFARCQELYSVDFVDRPAANPTGLFNAVDLKANIMDEKSILTKIKELLTGSEKLEPINFEAKAKELETNFTTLSNDHKKLTLDFSELTAKATALEADKAKLATDLAAAQATIANPEGEIEKRASAKALTIVASQGVQAPIAPPKPGFSESKETKASGFSKVESAFADQIKNFK